MAYQIHNFADGDILHARQLNEMDRQLASLETYTHRQNTAQSVWTIQHNLARFPSVTIVDSGDHRVIGEIQYIDENTVQVSFSGAFSGKAYLN